MVESPPQKIENYNHERSSSQFDPFWWSKIKKNITETTKQSSGAPGPAPNSWDSVIHGQTLSEICMGSGLPTTLPTLIACDSLIYQYAWYFCIPKLGVDPQFCVTNFWRSHITWVAGKVPATGASGWTVSWGEPSSLGCSWGYPWSSENPLDMRRCS